MIEPDGDQGYAVECNGAGNSLALCYERAAEICRNKRADYLVSEIVKINDSKSGNNQRSIIFKCNPYVGSVFPNG